MQDQLITLVFICLFFQAQKVASFKFMKNHDFRRICNINSQYSTITKSSNAIDQRSMALSALAPGTPDKITVIFRILAATSFIISLVGLSFQVFVLYPWHEELSYEFKTLEQSIIRLDETLEKKKPSITEETLNRITDKYTEKPDVYKAGPRISSVIKVFPDDEMELLNGNHVE